MIKVLVNALLLSLFFLEGCASYEQFRHLSEETEVPSQMFPFDFNQSWQASLKVMSRYGLEVRNQDTGTIKTNWIDNTLEVNFADSFGSNDTVRSARFKIILNVTKGFRQGKEVSKVTIYKRQMVEQDFLQGWKIIPTDGIQEKGILYRIERNLLIDARLKKIEDARAREAEADL